MILPIPRANDGKCAKCANYDYCYQHYKEHPELLDALDYLRRRNASTRAKETD